MYFSTTGMIWRPIFLASIDHLDILVVFEAVADDGRFVVGDGEHRQQFGFRSGFEAESVRAAELEDFFDHLALLVHLDGINAAVTALIVVLGDGVLEGLVQLAQADASGSRRSESGSAGRCRAVPVYRPAP